MLHRVAEGISWRWRRLTRRSYLRRTFLNGDELFQNYQLGYHCDTAVCRDRTVIRHPPGRSGLAGMILEIWFDEVYTGRFYTPRPGDVIVDAGANIGLFSLLIARTSPQCHIFAFEPFEENYRLLRENLIAANATTVRTFPYALTAANAVSFISDGGKRSQDHCLTAAGMSSRVAVRSCGLAEVLSLAGTETVAMFKCDIEGSERELFADASSEQLNRIDRLAIEYHDNLRPGTTSFLREQLSGTHILTWKPSKDGGYGMLYAISRNKLQT